jgi:hypothetical protein
MFHAFWAFYDIQRQADRVWRVLQNTNVSGFGGMMPTDWLLETGAPNDGVKALFQREVQESLTCTIIDRLTVGAQGDSAHEYMLKQYILTGKTDKRLVEMCTQSPFSFVHLVHTGTVV